VNVFVSKKLGSHWFGNVFFSIHKRSLVLGTCFSQSTNALWSWERVFLNQKTLSGLENVFFLKKKALADLRYGFFLIKKALSDLANMFFLIKKPSLTLGTCFSE
jgi:hypothetical protein